MNWKYFSFTLYIVRSVFVLVLISASVFVAYERLLGPRGVIRRQRMIYNLMMCV